VLFKLTSSTDFNGVVQLEMSSSYLFFSITTTTGSGTVSNPTGLSIPINTWTHFASSLKGTTATTYINGTLKSTQTSMNVPPAVNRAGCFVGYRPDAASDLSGYDEIRVYNRSLNATEIAADYNTASFISFV
jgi:hypothetical protein